LVIINERMKKLGLNWKSGENYVRRIFFVCFLTITISFSVHAELAFNSERLKQIFSMLPDVYKKEIFEFGFVSNFFG